ncbi:hypothetical protein FRB96_002373 [Tulasnella sp. 330]|nr:hypothetical protein FRB96_002373 [Tulasnella sp. 330]
MLPRFRKKSDAKRPSISLTQHVQQPQSPPPPAVTSPSRRDWQAPLTLLPASDDFRTSLILPDLSRRFSLLRQPDGRPVGIEDVREKFAEQRNHGSANVITEEEEEYVINYLRGAGHMPGGVVDDRHTADERNAFPSSTPNTPLDSPGGSSGVPHSAFQSTFTYTSPTTKGSPLSPAFSASSSHGYPSSPLTPSPPTSRASNTSQQSSKRLSNNLFGSRRYTDQNFMRGTVKKQQSNKSLQELEHQQAMGTNDDDSGRYAAGQEERNGDILEDTEDLDQAGLVAALGQAFSSPMEEEEDAEPTDGEGSSEDMSRPVTPSTSRNRETNLSSSTNLPAILPLTPKSPTNRSMPDNLLSTTPSGSPQVNGRGGGGRLHGGPVVFTSGQVHRASLALEEVIRNFEQDDSAEEQILTPRTTSGSYSTMNGHHPHPWVKSPSPPVRQLLSDGSGKSSPYPKMMGSASLQPEQRTEVNTPPSLLSEAQYVSLPPSRQYFQTTAPGSSQQHPWQARESPTSPSARAVSPLSSGSSRVPGYIPGMHRPISPPELPRGYEGINSPTSPSFPSPSPRKISSGLQQRLNALPFEAHAGIPSPVITNKAAQASERDTVIRQGVGGPSLSPITPSRGHGLSKIVPSSYGQGPISPPPRSSSLRKRPAVFEETNGKNDTDRSTSSSSVLPDTSSSSSMGSLASPTATEEQSDATSTLISSDNNTVRNGSSLKSPLSPHFPPQQQDRIVSSGSSGFGSIANGYGHGRSNSGGGSLKSSTTLLGAIDHRPDSPISQMYTGHRSQQPSLASVSKPATSAQTLHSSRTGFGRQAETVASKEPLDNGLASSTSSSTSAASFRTPASMLRKPGMTVTAPQLLKTWSDHRPMVSPALPESPLVGDFSDSGNALEKSLDQTTPSDTPTQPLQESQEIDQKPDNATSTRSVTPVTAARSPTPKGRAVTPISSKVQPSSMKSSFSRHQHERGRSDLSTGEGYGQDVTVKSPTSMKFDMNDNVHRFTASSPPPSSFTRTFSPKPMMVHSHSRSLSSSSSLGPSNNGLPPRSPSTSSRLREGYRMGSPQLSLQPMFNTSKSSLDSAGSSFHSMEGDRKSLTQLQLEGECSAEEKRDRMLITEDDTTESDHEDLLGLWGGLTRKDVAAIHDRLVSAAIVKAAIDPSPTTSISRPISPPFVTRRPSHNGNKTGSISQSLKSLSQDSEISSQKDSVLKDNSSKADALLRAMVESLPPMEPSPSATPASPSPNTGPSTSGTSPASLDAFKSILHSTTKADDTWEPRLQSVMPKRSPIPSLNDPDLRKRALTEALFGDASPRSEPSPNTSESHNHPYATRDLTLEDLEPVGRAKSTPSPRLPDEELVAAVSRKAAAATEALKSPVGAEMGLKRQGTKRINGKLISTPQLLSSTTSFGTVPIAAAETSSPSPTPVDTPKSSDKSGKLSLRIKQLRDKLKPSRSMTPNGDELTPWVDEARSTSPILARQGSVSALLADLEPRQPSPQPSAGPTSAVSPREARVPSPSPTTPRADVSSPGPGLKGFMSRLRSNSKRDTNDLTTPPNGHAGGFLSRSTSKKSVSSLKPSSSILSLPRTHLSSSHAIEEENEKQEQEEEQGQEARIVDLQSPRQEQRELWFDLATPAPLELTHDDAAVKQLFEAASNLGLDRSALTDLLARSTSVSSKATGWNPAATRSNSLITANIPPAASPKTSDALLLDEGLKRTPSTRTGAALSRVVEHPGGLAPVAHTDQLIIRRTLIFPSDGESGLMRKGSAATARTSKKQKRASTTSVQSSHSVQDRVPTPPPKHASKRFSKERSPPLPSLPTQFASPKRDSTPRSSFLGQSARSHQSMSSAYGSLFDMYGEDTQSLAPSMPSSPGLQTNEGMGQALEVVELSNGEVVWSVVDAMRNDVMQDDDGASLYQSRQSISSDTSYIPRDGVQVLFKEHRRMGSKGSATSSISARRKPAANRPETKVFFSSAAHIGRLIESMSRGADSGSFNIVPAIPDSPKLPDVSFLAKFGGKHSPAPSMTDNSYSVEDRLEHLLKLTSRAQT